MTRSYSTYYIYYLVVNLLDSIVLGKNNKKTVFLVRAVLHQLALFGIVIHSLKLFVSIVDRCKAKRYMPQFMITKYQIYNVSLTLAS